MKARDGSNDFAGLEGVLDDPRAGTARWDGAA